MTMNPRQNAPTFEFADTSPVRLGRKHRRGKGHAASSSRTTSSSTASSGGRSSSSNSNAASGHAAGIKSYRNGGHNYSSAASEASSVLGVQSRLRHQSQQQANYYTGDAWDNNNPSGNNANNKDDNSCTGSLTYSASSSVQDESSNDSSFADIIKLIESEGGEGSEIKEFIAKQSNATIGSSIASKTGAAAGGNKDAAVAGWIQRVEDRSRLQHTHEQTKETQGQNQKHANRKNRMFSMEQTKHPPSNGHVDLNYSKDDSSEDDVFGVDFDENVLETIAG